MALVINILSLLLLVVLVRSDQSTAPLRSFMISENVTYDCIDIYMQPGLDHPLLKTHKIQMKPTVSRTELKNHTGDDKTSFKTRIGCPTGTVPILRNIKEFITTSEHFADKDLHPLSADSPGTHIAGVRSRNGPFHGVEAFFDGHNLNIGKDQASYNQIYIGSGLNNEVNFISAGLMGKDGKGCYNTACYGFVQVSETAPIVEPIDFSPGKPSWLHYSIHQDKNTGNWWLTQLRSDAPNEDIGYWPKELFNLFQNGANMVGVGGVVQASHSGSSPPMEKFLDTLQENRADSDGQNRRKSVGISPIPTACRRITGIRRKSVGIIVDGFSTARTSDGFPTTRVTDGFPTTRATDGFPTTRVTDGFPTGKTSDGFPTAENENLRVFSFKELKKATKNFRQDRVVIDGGSVRTFYKGYINETTFAPSRSETEIAVSVFECPQDSSQALQEWMEKVKSQEEISHPNLVKLLVTLVKITNHFSWFSNTCAKEVWTVIYSEVKIPSNYCLHSLKSVYKILMFLSTEEEVLPWEIRVQIAIQTAQGIAFLHSIKNSSIHQEIRMQNIILDEQYNAKLFYCELNQNCVLDKKGRLAGGFGYIAPELAMTDHIGMEGDVYTFGVILLELLTGLKAFDTDRNKAKRNLVFWSKSFLSDKDKIREIIDPRHGNDYPAKAARRMGQVIKWCIQQDKRNRPMMQQVLMGLNIIAKTKD
ncbi:unnamed protein product [Arabis nemorensis]|uniref:Uncharacterized protein n=1 Tax=Arabis nemorensis TaxID=586526 RepID=A0A565CKJ3_9BRAS|nr:unnamed protein product [Arabis nemorensis]